MNDWYSIIFGALWIFGAGLDVAGLSFANHLAYQYKQPFRKMLETPAFESMVYGGLFLFCLGWTGLTGGWERIIWGILSLVFIVKTWQKGRLRRA
jgi:hypothetical protein